MLSGDDVVNLKGSRMQYGGQQTVFATPCRPLTDAPNVLGFTLSYVSEVRKDRLALDCITASRLPT